MSAIPQALPIPRVLSGASAGVARAKTNPNLKYLLTMVKGQSRPPDEEIERLRAEGRDVPVVLEAVGIYDTRGKAEAVEDWCKRQDGAHPRDRYQIAPFVENAILPRAGIYLADDAESPPASDYEVVEKSELERVLQRVEQLANKDG